MVRSVDDPTRAGRRRRQSRADAAAPDCLRQIRRDQAFGRARDDVAGDQLADLLAAAAPASTAARTLPTSPRTTVVT